MKIKKIYLWTEQVRPVSFNFYYNFSWGSLDWFISAWGADISSTWNYSFSSSWLIQSKTSWACETGVAVNIPKLTRFKTLKIVDTHYHPAGSNAWDIVHEISWDVSSILTTATYDTSSGSNIQTIGVNSVLDIATLTKSLSSWVDVHITTVDLLTWEVVSTVIGKNTFTLNHTMTSEELENFKNDATQITFIMSTWNTSYNSSLYLRDLLISIN